MTEYYNSGGKYLTRVNTKKTKACQLWENIRNRSEYLPLVEPQRFAKYLGVNACEGWLDYQNFAEWFDYMQSSGYYHEGWQLDKDLLLKGNKTYCPKYCTFLPRDINNLLNVKQGSRGDLPMGLSYQKDQYGNFIGLDMRFKCKDRSFSLRKFLPLGAIEFGFSEYKKARLCYIKHLTETYKDKLEPRAYEALMCYDISIED